MQYILYHELSCMTVSVISHKLETFSQKLLKISATSTVPLKTQSIQYMLKTHAYQLSENYFFYKFYYYNDHIYHHSNKNSNFYIIKAYCTSKLA